MWFVILFLGIGWLLLYNPQYVKWSVGIVFMLIGGLFAYSSVSDELESRKYKKELAAENLKSKEEARRKAAWRLEVDRSLKLSAAKVPNCTGFNLTVSNLSNKRFFVKSVRLMWKYLDEDVTKYLAEILLNSYLDSKSRKQFCINIERYDYRSTFGTFCLEDRFGGQCGIGRYLKASQQRQTTYTFEIFGNDVEEHPTWEETIRDDKKASSGFWEDLE